MVVDCYNRNSNCISDNFRDKSKFLSLWCRYQVLQQFHIFICIDKFDEPCRRIVRVMWELLIKFIPSKSALNTRSKIEDSLHLYLYLQIQRQMQILVFTNILCICIYKVFLRFTVLKKRLYNPQHECDWLYKKRFSILPIFKMYCS